MKVVYKERLALTLAAISSLNDLSDEPVLGTVAPGLPVIDEAAAFLAAMSFCCAGC